MYLRLSVFFATFILIVSEAFAGPGGFVAKALIKSPIGIFILCLLTIIFLPLFIYIYAKERKAVKRTLKLLNEISKYDKNFNWLNLKTYIEVSFKRIYIAWNEGDISTLNDYMASWFMQNQDIIYLKQYEKEGVRNVCMVHSINSIKPVLCSLSSEKFSEGSHLVVLIDAKVLDYKIEKNTGKIIEGKNEYINFEFVYTYELQDSKWKVNSIAEGRHILQFCDMTNSLPKDFLEIAREIAIENGRNVANSN